MKRALELDPLSLIIQSGIGRILHFAGRFDEAVAQYRHVLETNPEFAQAHIDLALTPDGPRRAGGGARRARPGRARWSARCRRSCCSTPVARCARGELETGRAAFRDLEDRYRSGTAGADDLAMLAAVLGDAPAALAWLTEACAQRAPFLGYVEVEPAMQPLLQDPACRALLQQHGFRAGASARAHDSRLSKPAGGPGGQEEFIFSPTLLHRSGHERRLQPLLRTCRSAARPAITH